MSTEAAIWLNGAPAEALPLPDRGLDFGDGLFETLLLQQGSPLYTELHLQRLAQGLRTLSFPTCLDRARDDLARAATWVAGRAWDWSALRLTACRGPGPRGYAAPAGVAPRIVISAVELSRDCATMLPPARLSLATLRWGTQPALAGIKHLNRLEQVLAATEYRAVGSDEAIMLDQAGQLVSVTAGNLFLVSGGRILTPALRECGVAGTRRRLVLEQWAPAIGLATEEAALYPQDLLCADEVFYSNSLLGLRPVASFGAGRWREHPVCEALHRQYRGECS